MCSLEQPKAVPTLLIDNDRVMVTRWEFAPESHTGWHVHQFAYVVVPLTDGYLRLDTPTGTAAAQLEAGRPYDRPAGIEHDVVNVGPGDVVFVEIEMKAHPLA
jgi:quercetin dioxygenase-like cupin family protein